MKKRVLVCDDDRDILDLVSLILEDQYDIETEIDSTKLIRKAEEIRPDVILLDLWMPKVTGDQLTTFIKKLPALKDTPVVIFSASRDGRSKALDSGADEFIAKPFDIDKLSAVVEQYCA